MYTLSIPRLWDDDIIVLGSSQKTGRAGQGKGGCVWRLSSGGDIGMGHPRYLAAGHQKFSERGCKETSEHSQQVWARAEGKKEAGPR